MCKKIHPEGKKKSVKLVSKPHSNHCLLFFNYYLRRKFKNIHHKWLSIKIFKVQSFSHVWTYICVCLYRCTYRKWILTCFFLPFHILVFKIFFCSQCKWSLVHLLSPRTVMSHHLTNKHAFATKRHFNWELSHPSSPLGLVKIFICLLELISACLSPAGDFRVV